MPHANALNALPVDVVDSSRQMADRCGAAKVSSFTATGRGGMPQGPMKRQGTDRSWTDLRSLTATISTLSQPIVGSQPLIEASAIRVDESGSTMLVAAKSTLVQTAATCGMGDSSTLSQ